MVGYHISSVITLFHSERPKLYANFFSYNPIARRKAKIVYNFALQNAIGLSFNVMGYRLSLQGSYVSGKCQGNLKVFKVRKLSGNFIIWQGKLNFC